MPQNTDIKLDVKDKKILFELDFDARQSNAAIAKKVGLSKQGVDYRIKRLLKTGVVAGFYPVINIGSLGYFYCRLFIRWHNLTRAKEEEICAGLAKDKRISWIVAFDGAYNIVVAAYTKSLGDFKRLSEEILERYGHYIKEKRESIGTKVIHFQSRYLLGSQETGRLVVGETKGAAIVDNVDVELLRLLTANARMPLVELGSKLNISPKVAAYRIKRLEKQKVILGYRPNISHGIIGYAHYKVLFYLSNVNKQELQRFKSYLMMLPEVIYVVEEVGIADVDVEIMLPKTASLFTFLKAVKYFAPRLIRDYEILIADKTLKIEYVPF